jgi:hypothetical protein
MSEEMMAQPNALKSDRNKLKLDEKLSLLKRDFYHLAEGMTKQWKEYHFSLWDSALADVIELQADYAEMTRNANDLSKLYEQERKELRALQRKLEPIKEVE